MYISRTVQAVWEIRKSGTDLQKSRSSFLKQNGNRITGIGDVDLKVAGT